jgi:hypothetical protein
MATLDEVSKQIETMLLYATNRNSHLYSDHSSEHSQCSLQEDAKIIFLSGCTVHEIRSILSSPCIKLMLTFSKSTAIAIDESEHSIHIHIAQ